MDASITPSDSPLVGYMLSRADDALILGHRLSEWCGHAPLMEEDMALSNIALDLIGQARALYAHAAVVDGAGRDEDAYAYLRDVTEYRNLLLVELPKGDFAVTIVRQFLYSTFADAQWRALCKSADVTLAAIAAKAEKESAYHVRHAGEWVVRLGDGTDESHQRAQRALDDLWPFTGEMFMASPSERPLAAAGVVVDVTTLGDAWRASVAAVVERACLTLPVDGWMQRGGREGRHTEHLGHLLSELQYLQRAYPGATW